MRLLDSLVVQTNGHSYLEAAFDTTGPWLARKMLYESLYNNDTILAHDSLMHSFYANQDTTDLSVILQSELANQSLTDSATLADTTSSGGKPSGYADALSNASYLTNHIPAGNMQAVNYAAMSNIYLETAIAGVDTFTDGQLDTITALAIQCPYTAGDAVYIARALYAQYDNTIFFDDLAICTPDSRELRSLRVSYKTTDSTNVTPSDFVLVYPNPAKNILKVYYSSATSGSMTFELTDLMGQTFISQQVANMSTIEIDVSHVASSLYLWKGRSGNLVIQTGKVSVQK